MRNPLPDIIGSDGTAMRPALLVIAAALALTGCIRIPAPWSYDKAKAVSRAEDKADVARDAVLRRAQSETTVAAIALRSAPPSRPVEIAREATAAAESMQAQALGALPEAERQRLEKLVADLQSEIVAVRSAAEKQRDADSVRAAREAVKLSAANAKVDDLNGKLAAAYQREKVLGDTVRRFVWTCIGLAVLAVILGAAWLYLRYALGGFAPALGKVLGSLDRSQPDVAKIVRGLLDSELNRHEQARVRAAVTT